MAKPLCKDSLSLSPLDLLRTAAEIDIVHQIDVPPRLPRYRNLPSHMGKRRMLAWVLAMTGRSDLRLHQALALDAVRDGQDVVVATATASGKSLVFQAATILEMIEGDGVAIALYPLKALAADQMVHWRRALTAANLPTTLVAELTGDTPMHDRDTLLVEARILVCTPDVIHSWLMRQVSAPAVRALLNRLRFVIVDEGHSLEGEFGSNCSYLFRRLQCAQFRARQALGADSPPFQIIAATATIANPRDHMKRLTGRNMTVITEDDNGAPRAGRTLLHIDGPAHGQAAERMLADILRNLADLIGSAAFIAFHDSRQGVERIARLVDRNDVLPYRSGYEASDRALIEAALRAGTLRGVIATSSLELGIDIPQFAMGFTIGIPTSRKSYQQRVGRVGRTREGLFAVIAPAAAFAQIASSLDDYYHGEVEPCALYLDNPSIQFTQARCLIDECDAFDGDMELPEGADWPTGFDRVFAMAKPGAARPREFDMIAAHGANNPHLNYPLRHICDAQYSLKYSSGASEQLGSITLQQAIREAYPGATYYHFRQACRVRDWHSSSFERAIRLDPAPRAGPTTPVLRKQVTVSRAAEDIVNRRHMAGERGFLAELKVQVTESVEGYRTNSKTMLYRDLRQTDPRMKRKQRDFSSTGVILQISEPWFAGQSEIQVETRQLVARALKELLIREQCIQPRDIDYGERSVAIQALLGPQRVDDVICIYDTVFGSLRLSAPLFDKLPVFIERLSRAADVAGDDALLPAELAAKLAAWFAHLAPCDAMSAAPSCRLLPGEYLIFAPGSELSITVRGEILERTISEPQMLTIGGENMVMYSYEAEPGIKACVPHDQLCASGHNWRYAVWTPVDGQIRDLEEAA